MSRFIFDNIEIFDEYFENKTPHDQFIKKNKFILDWDPNFTGYEIREYKHDYGILHNVFVNNDGVVITHDNKIMVNGACLCKKSNINNNGLHIYNENVITITGMWSYGIWHFPFESLTALSVIPEKILYNSKIHVGVINNYIIQWCDMLGIKKEQLITGNIRCNKVYFPRMGMCGNPYYSQILWIKELIQSNQREISEDEHDSLVILIKRNHTRTIINYSELENEIIKFSHKNEYNFYIHDDSCLPSLKEQQQIFSKAKYVFAPHGAGGIHLPALKNDCSYIEFLNEDNRNICYARLAYFLDISYYGITISNNKIDIERLNKLFNEIV